MYRDFKFAIKSEVGRSRAGKLLTPHGVVNTPVFMPVGTKATVKSLSASDVNKLGADILLANTYHLYLRPGENLIEQSGGLHEFMRWQRPILTDSGGFQVSSLGLSSSLNEKSLSRIDENGVTFFSHLDGSKHRFDAEKVIKIQHDLGSDIIMAFDECTPNKEKAYARKAMRRTHRWLVRSKNKWEELEGLKAESGRLSQVLFGIIQGGNYRDLRRESAKFVRDADLPGLAIGGGSIGRSPEETSENVDWVYDLLPLKKPLYLMGVGVGPTHVVEAIKSGADMFDCVAPTKLARSGLLFTGKLEISENLMESSFESQEEGERINISNLRFARDQKVIDPDCDCPTCVEGYSRAYLRHLFKARELLYFRLATMHNIRMMTRVVEQMRSAILKAGK